MVKDHFDSEKGNSLPPWRIDPTTHRTMSERSYHWATSRSCYISLSISQRYFKQRLFLYITVSGRKPYVQRHKLVNKMCALRR